MNTPVFPSIVWLGEPPAQDPALVGHQVATLNQLVDLHRVPPGFCLTAAALQSAPPLQLWMDEVAAAYRRLADRCGAAEPAVTIRLCPVGENDQVKTYFNVQGVTAMVAAIQQGWAAGGLAVLVQQFIDAGVTALAHSANPSTGNRDEVVINATWGLGEGIQAGPVTPDTYIVSKANPVVYAVRVAEKLRKLVAIPGGVGLVEVPPGLRRELALSEGQIVEITQLAQLLEAQLGWPVEVECAYKAETLYLLQCQPIAAIFSNAFSMPSMAHNPF
jgi:pyruvate,water dikinase